MEISFLGAAQEVGRSSIFLSGKDRILLDCGLKIHADQTFPLEPPEVPDYVVVSHAHLDHTGFLPALFKHGKPEMVCTPPTLAMAEVIVEDSMRIMAKRGEFPYRGAHIKKMKQAATLLSYKKWYELGDATLQFYQAGHIPGAAISDIDTGNERIVYTGDFKGEETKTTFAPELPPKNPDALIIESTYSDRDHPSRKELEIEFGRQLEETLEAGGSVLLPSFAIGRTQELIRIVRSVNHDVDIWVDGMGWEITELLSHFSSYMKDFKRLRHNVSTCKPVTHRKMRESVLKKPGVIISTAGMLQGGPAMQYLLRLGPESKTIFTGYSVEGTNGHNLQNKGFVEYDGVRITPKCTHSYLDFSAHAGRSELFWLVEELSPQKVFCVHGDKCQQFAEELKVEGFDAYAPALGETVKI
ncbi:MAG: MBL fold metallo-hydrolase [Candidatus Anstonellaceae archaeon]